MGRWLIGTAGVVVLLAVVGAGAGGALAPQSPTPTPTPAAATLRARGVVQPIARASIATLAGGVVDQLPTQVGQTVDAQQPIARVSLPGQTEMLVAPWRGSITGVNVHLGDTVVPGTVIATIADLSAYQVETTDVDEYLIAYIRPGQRVEMTLEALDALRLQGTVKSVSLQQQGSSNGATNYPVTIALAGGHPGLRPGMTVRLTFSQR